MELNRSPFWWQIVNGKRCGYTSRFTHRQIAVNHEEATFCVRRISPRGAFGKTSSVTAPDLEFKRGEERELKNRFYIQSNLQLGDHL